MEADKFDRLMAEKLGQADVPQYSESKWASFHSGLPSSGFGMSWSSQGLILLLVLSNAWWVWNFAGEQNEVSEPEPPVHASKVGLAERDDPVIDKRTFIVYDTVRRVVEVERIAYVNAVKEDHSANSSTTLANDESMKVANKSDIRIDRNGVVESETIAGKEVRISETGHQGAVSATDSLGVGEDEVQESMVMENTEPDKEKQRTPYAGPRWFIGINGQKPFSTGKQKAFSGAGLGVNLEYMPAGWIALIAEANFLNYGYVIEDVAFYEKVRESSDPDLYEPGGVYGSGYSWEQSEVNKGTVQAGMFFKLSNPVPKSGIRPFASSGYVIELYAKTDVTNKLIESGTNKVVRVESVMPSDYQNQYIRSEIGVESQLNSSFWLRLSADHWMEVSGSPHESDWIGGKVVIIYGLR